MYGMQRNVCNKNIKIILIGWGQCNNATFNLITVACKWVNLAECFQITVPQKYLYEQLLFLMFF
jgi:hypothetical protein